MANPWARFVVLVSLTLGLAGLQSPARASYQLLDLGAINVPGSFQIQAMNTSGVVVGTSTTSGGQRAYVWSPSSGSGAVPMPTNSTTSTGLAINAAGDVTGSFNNTDTGGTDHAFVYTAQGKFLDMGTLPNGSAAGVAVNADRAVAATGYTVGGVMRAGRMTDAGGATLIDVLAGGRTNYATGINGLGVVVGGSDVGNGITHAFVSRSGSAAEDLFSSRTNPGFQGSTYATAINDLNIVIGNGQFGSGSHAFVAFSNGTTRDIGVVGGAASSYALAISNSNQVVGNLDFGGGSTHAFLWTAPNQLVDLQAILSSQDRASWTLTQALAINDAGTVFGVGFRDGSLHAYAFTLDSAVPEPSTLVLTAVGLVGLGLRAQSKRGRSSGRAVA